MATLQSPGVSVSVIDESFYAPAAPGTVPMIFVATGQDKPNGSGTGTAQGTTAANAGKVWVITSQRDLSDTFGTPYFETDAEGNPVHGGELNEYGLQAAYSALGVSSKAYVVRADVDTMSLMPDASTPGGTPVNGTYWLVSSSTLFGVQEWDSSTGQFTNKTPIIIDNSNVDAEFDEAADGGNGRPTVSAPKGTYAMVITSDNDTNHIQGLYYKSSSGWVLVEDGFDSGKKVRLSPHYDYPNFTNTGTDALSATTGSIWIKTTTPGLGANWDLRVYSAESAIWNIVSAPLYADTQEAISQLDGVTGGGAITPGAVFVEYDPEKQDTADFKLWIRYSSGPTTINVAGGSSAYNQNWSFGIRSTDASGNWGSTSTIHATASTTVDLGFLVAEGINTDPYLENVSATWDGSVLSITHALGGNIEFSNTAALGGLNGPLEQLNFASSPPTGLYPAPKGTDWDYVATNWKPLVYESLEIAPTTEPDDGQLWFDSNLEADIMYNDGQHWVGYATAGAFPNSDPMGPTISASKPTKQQDGTTALVNGDIWIDTSMPDEYGHNIYVYDGTKWNLSDVTDHDSPNGWVFADARWATEGMSDMAASIADLLTSDYVDPDCPDPRLYPRGTRLFNTRRSGNNIKKYHHDYIDINVQNPRLNESMIDYFPSRWVTASPNDEQKVGQFGRKAQRSVITKALTATVAGNTTIRDTDTLVFNLIVCPGYPELIQDMVSFNIDRGLTGFVIGDTPFRLPANGTTLNNYGFNTAQSLDNNDVSAVTYDSSLAMFYPSGYTNDNLGNNIVVPPSHIMLRTIINSDNVSYPWFAPAGTRRGVVDNVSSVGYIDAETGEFKSASLYQGLRDVLQTPGININPIATLPGVGIVNMGQKTRAHGTSALDRINVSRLISYLRYQLSVMVKPYLFEPNDSQTRHEVKNSIDAMLSELVSQRALYDFLTVCDGTNNTPARIDRSELWVDIAIEPVKAVEFIYIPLRILNTGGIANLNK